mmetsp:Transcript_27088/g.78586  ORF Transcript_27088/g.78586 Transcript_27088/m.78586 type:complete len:288 (+) Transcript_27088:1886-2749(+)
MARRRPLLFQCMHLELRLHAERPLLQDKHEGPPLLDFSGALPVRCEEGEASQCEPVDVRVLFGAPKGHASDRVQHGAQECQRPQVDPTDAVKEVPQGHDCVDRQNEPRIREMVGHHLCRVVTLDLRHPPCFREQACHHLQHREPRHDDFHSERTHQLPTALHQCQRCHAQACACEECVGHLRALLHFEMGLGFEERALPLQGAEEGRLHDEQDAVGVAKIRYCPIPECEAVSPFQAWILEAQTDSRRPLVLDHVRAGTSALSASQTLAKALAGVPHHSINLRSSVSN